MSIFINRAQELAFLEKKYKSHEAELVILYGRRRIGKTELVLRFCEDKESLYFIGRLESREDTIKRFNNLLIEAFNDASLLNMPLRDWDAIADYLAEKAEKRFILVLDEFPFIVERFPEIISILQDKWDAELKKTKIMIALCGSSISMMEKYALDYKSPLYGRRTGQWKVDMMNVIHLDKFFPKYSIEDLIHIYSYLDMIPGYLTQFSSDKPLVENVKEKIFSKGEFLYEEIEILLREELRDPSNYMSIIASIAGGLTTFNEIYTKTGLDKSLLSKYLSVLESISVLEKVLPITDSYKSKLKAKGALYSLKDNFFDFWFRFVYLNKQELEKGNAEGVVKSMKGEMERYVSRKFESFVRELVALGIAGGFTKIGRWWKKEEEIDLVAMNEEKNEILFGECKWQNNIAPLNIIAHLHEKATAVVWRNKNRKEIYALFAKSFAKKVKEFNGKKVYCFDLKDIEKFVKKHS